MADFHSLRSYFISALVRSGASIAEVHKLARHAKRETTLKHYAKVSAHDLRGAVESMPAPSRNIDDEETAKMAATGTDCIIHKQTLAHHLPTGGDGTVRIHVVAGGTSGSDSEMSMGSEIPGNEARDGRVRTLAGRRTERGGFEPPKPVSQFNGLANRRYRPLSHLSCSGRPRVRIPR